MDTLESLRDRVAELEQEFEFSYNAWMCEKARAQAAEAKLAGLLEAVGPFIPWAREQLEFWGDNQPDETKTAWMGGHVFTLGHCRSMLAAYDATK